MILSPDKEAVSYKHLLERRHNATARTQEWHELRIRHKEELTLISPLPVSIAIWLRQKQEVAELGTWQQQQLTLLLVRHRQEMEAVNLP
ncbi:hypothetical protein [Spirosoma areae]